MLPAKCRMIGRYSQSNWNEQTPTETGMQMLRKNEIEDSHHGIDEEGNTDRHRTCSILQPPFPKKVAGFKLVTVNAVEGSGSGTACFDKNVRTVLSNITPPSLAWSESHHQCCLPGNSSRVTSAPISSKSLAMRRECHCNKAPYQHNWIQ